MNVDPSLPWSKRVRARIRLALSFRITNISLPADSRKFRLAVAPLLVFVLVLGQLGLLCFVLVMEGLRFDWGVLVFSSVSIAILSLGGAWMLSYLFPDVVSPEGVYGHSSWGRRRFARWEDIAVVEAYGLFHLRYLRLHSKSDEGVTWIGLFHVGADDFRQEIQRLAPIDNPIQPFVQ